jgi:hypothetical protein
MRIKLIGPLFMYSYRRCFFPGFPAIARVSEVAAVLPAVKFSHSAHTEYELRDKRNKLLYFAYTQYKLPHSAYTEYKRNFIPHILSIS